MPFVKALGFAGVAALACTGSALAQDFSGNLRARVTYDDATARSSDAFAAARGLQQDDVIGDILATFDVKRAMGSQEVYAGGSVGYDFHKKNTQLDRERIDVRGGVRRDVGPCSVDVEATYSRSQTDLEDLEFETIKNALERKGVKLGTTCRRIIGIAPQFEVSQIWSDNSAASRQEVNSETLNGSVGLAYYRPALGSVVLYGEYRETQYPNRLVLVNGELVQDGFEHVSGGIRYNRRIGARLGGSLFAGYSSVDAKFPGVPGFEGVTYGGGLTYRPSSRMNTHFNFSRDARPSNRLDSTYAVSDSYTLGATYALGARMSLSLSGTHRTNGIEGVSLTPGVDITDEETNSVSGAISMRVGRRLSLSLDAAYQERTADAEGFNYESQRVGLTATTGF